jgi:predicted component of type VI protein secretion system
LYLALCDIVGDLAMLKGELYLPEVPAYDHLDPLASFEVLELHIRSMLDSLAQRFRILRFIPTGQGRFELAFHPADLGERLIVGAMRAKDQSVDSIQAWMTHADIATSQRLPELKPKRIIGPPRLPVGRVEALDLSPPALTSLFEIEPSAEFIDRNDSLLIIENSASGGPTSILLYAALDAPGREPAR